METIWIIGAGKFGLRAAKWLGQSKLSFEVTLVDLDRESLSRAKDLGCRVEAGDGIDFLYKNLNRDTGPDWIVPAVPVHLAWEWCRLYLGKDRVSPWVMPEELHDLLPNPMTGSSQDIYVSHADFLCPPNCNEPDQCTKTGMPRQKDMFALLRDVDYDGILPCVIRSVQLGPGVGGYPPSSLFNLANRISRHRGVFFAATACRCHGVISGGQIR